MSAGNTRKTSNYQEIVLFANQPAIVLFGKVSGVIYYFFQIV